MRLHANKTLFSQSRFFADPFQGGSAVAIHLCFVCRLLMFVLAVFLSYRISFRLSYGKTVVHDCNHPG